MKNLLILIIILFSIISCNPKLNRPTVYEPKDINNVLPLYVDGNPIAAVVTDASVLQSSLEFEKLSHRWYIRAWINFTNLSNNPILLEPMKSFKLTQIDIAKKSKKEINPEYPSTIISMLEKEKEAVMIANVFWGILEAASTTATTYYASTGESIQSNDLTEKLNVVTRNTALRNEIISRDFDKVLRSLNSIFLKKNTVFPNQTISGFVFFEIGRGIDVKYEADQYAYELHPRLANINLTISFLPVLGD